MPCCFGSLLSLLFISDLTIAAMRSAERTAAPDMWRFDDIGVVEDFDGVAVNGEGFENIVHGGLPWGRRMCRSDDRHGLHQRRLSVAGAAERAA